MSVDCSPYQASAYLGPGQILMVGGESLMIDDAMLHVVQGVTVRRPGVVYDRTLAGEGEALTQVNLA